MLQHIVDASHLVLIMNMWLLYDLNGVEPKQLIIFLCFEQLVGNLSQTFISMLLLRDVCHLIKDTFNNR